ncbi:MAG: amino acid ABC transporter substrate-binding protein [Hyphomicrobiaceae bacterium]|nr:amino acid ABC transporter substrate-binding protein [Hyphomicrobiaceae bacterium]
MAIARTLKYWLCAVVIVGGSLALGVRTADAVTSTTLDAVKARGYINCGVGENSPGFSQVDSRGRWSGLEVEFCSALAAAVFGNKSSVKFRALQTSDRFKALQEGEVDVMLRGTSWTLSRDSELGAHFTAVLFYDGQGFLVPRSHAVSSVLELSGASICVLPGGAGERAVAEFFTRTKMRYQLITSPRWEDLVQAYVSGGCTVLTGDVSLLAHERSKLASPDDHSLLPEEISKEPIGPYVRAGDEAWFTIVRWTVMALIAGEEMGLTSSNVSSMESSSFVDVRRFLGQEANLGQPLGLARDWAEQVVRQVGNYSEIFERTFGKATPLRLERGLNNLWMKGGLMYAAPFR